MDCYPSHEELVQFACRLAGLPIEGPVIGFEFSGKHYAMILRAIFPRAVDCGKICWALKPIQSQLDSNLQYFVTCCRSVESAELPFPEEATVSSLQSCPVNIAPHLAVLLWLHRNGRRFGVQPDYDPVEMLLVNTPMLAAPVVLNATAATALQRLEVARVTLAGVRAEFLRMVRRDGEIDYQRLASMLDSPWTAVV